MPFSNNNIKVTTFSGTTIDATGGSIFSGSSELSGLFISKKRKLVASNHNIAGLVQNSGSTAESIFEQYSFPAGTFKADDTMEFWWSSFFSSSTGTNSKTLRIRLGTAGTVADSAIFTLTTSNANLNLIHNFQLRFPSNNAFESATPSSTSYWGAPVLAYFSASTLNLNTSTTYISFTATRTVLSADTVTARYADIYQNKY